MPVPALRYLTRSVLFAALLLTLLAAMTACTSVPVEPESPSLTTKEVTAAMFARAQALYLSEDYVNAAKLMRVLAGQGHLQAQYTLGYMYYVGQGLPRNEREAIRWLSVAAARGDSKAREALELLEQDGPTLEMMR